MLPRLVDALRLEIGPAWLFLIAAEAVAADSGLGYRIFLVRRYLSMDVIIPYVIWITILVNINLAIFNLLPIPVLDGGHLLFLLIEKVKGSPVSNRVMGYSQVVGLVFVLLLVLFVTYNDIVRLL